MSFNLPDGVTDEDIERHFGVEEPRTCDSCGLFNPIGGTDKGICERMLQELCDPKEAWQIAQWATIECNWTACNGWRETN